MAGNVPLLLPSKYNSTQLYATLPSGVEAFFYLKTPRCQGSGCEQKARAGRATFASDYSLGPGEAPLLSFDPGNWEAPFAVPEE